MNEFIKKLEVLLINTTNSDSLGATTLSNLAT